METMFLFLASVFIGLCSFSRAGVLTNSPTSQCVPPDMTSFYDYSTKDMEGNNVPFKLYRRHITLVVNVATFSRFADQYKDLNKLMEQVPGNKAGQCGLMILGFPSNQIGYKEPASDATQFRNGLMYVSPGGLFVPNFPIFNKVILNGEREDPIFTYLKMRCPTPRLADSLQNSNFTYQPSDIRENFEKILINHAGHPVKRYLSTVKPLDLLPEIQKLTLKCHKDEFLAEEGLVRTTTRRPRQSDYKPTKAIGHNDEKSPPPRVDPAAPGSVTVEGQVLYPSQNYPGKLGYGYGK